MSVSVKDSGHRKTFASGAKRDRNKGKGKPSLIHWISTYALSVVMEAGAEKYEAWNWAKGMPIGEYLDSAKRHIDKFLAGYRDEPHLGQAMFNLMGAAYTYIMVKAGLYPPELNDLLPELSNADVEKIEKALQEWNPYKNENKKD